MAKGRVAIPHKRHDSALRQERQLNHVPFSISPFVQDSDSESSKLLNGHELVDGELPVKVAAKEPWTDLLLEVAMTTAFASLTDGIPILRQRALLSYLSFFILVWWIWASQVAYNLRFRQSDWLHRIYVFMQLAIFSALAAFTRDFDITAGFMRDGDQALENQLLMDLGFDVATLQAIQFRDNRLPRLNARGVAMTMALSRLLLLVQYLVVLYRGRHLKRNALIAHTVPLAFSSSCFFLSFLILGTSDGPVPKSMQITKVLLWYGPMLLEIISYFLADELPGRVGYPTEGVIARSGSVFIIILGGGLDKITTGFQYIVGNTGLAVDGIGLFISAAVIFVSQFSLYFGSTGVSRKLSGHRSIAWFFSHFFYLSALIMALQGVATSLTFSNINHAIQTQLGGFLPTLKFIQQNPGVNLTVSDFPQSQHSFEKMGLSFPGVINILNTNIELGLQQNAPDMAERSWLQQSINLIQHVLEPFNAEPAPRSILWAKLQLFVTASPDNVTRVNMVNWWDIYDGMVKAHGSSALWFFPVAGTTLIALAALSLIRGKPRDRFEWASVISRLLVGCGTVVLSMLDVGSSKPTFDGNGVFTSSKIWQLNWTNWVLPIFALSVVGLGLIEFVLAYLAGRSYHSFDAVPFWTERSYDQLNRQQPYYPYQHPAVPQKAFSVSAHSHGSFPSQPFQSVESYGSYPYSNSQQWHEGQRYY